jgi:hypothetical protein
VVFILSTDGLAFAHDGKWLTVQDFINLTDGWSDKDPNECIGHKGVGFRSVLDLTPAPHLFRVGSNEFFGVKFAWALNMGHINETLNKNPHLHDDYAEWSRRGGSVCPIMAIPGLINRPSGAAIGSILRRAEQKDYGWPLTTLFWLPGDDPDISSEALRDLGPNPILANDAGRRLLSDFMSKEVAQLIPFLKTIEIVEIYDDSGLIITTSCSRVPQKEDSTICQVAVLSPLTQSHEVHSFFLVRKTIAIPPEIRNARDTPKALKGMREATVAAAVRLEPQPTHDPDSRFHVYFPTEEKTGTGFTVHGDFHITPDRKRLMRGGYNSWLLKTGAKLCANRLLSGLLAGYDPKLVYETFAPSELSAQSSTVEFIALFGEAMKQRKAAFVATGSGMVLGQEAVLPPMSDPGGFWAAQFSDVVSSILSGRKAFVEPRTDTRLARSFLKLAGIEVLKHESFLDLFEAGAKETRSPEWWYGCYVYCAEDPALARRDSTFFVGRRLLLVNGEPYPVPSTSHAIVSLPPPTEHAHLAVPSLFASTFVILDRELADRIDNGPSDVRDWCFRTFSLARFEATDLIPRAVRRISPSIFSGHIEVRASDLLDAWRFVHKVVPTGRRIESEAFWRDLGRMPLPLEHANVTGALNRTQLAPAFLTYWPDSFLEGNNPLQGATRLRRIDIGFLSSLAADGESPEHSWREFLERVGISSRPKLLTFSRVVSEEQFAVDEDGNLLAPTVEFQGERQNDENLAVASATRGWLLWEEGRRPYCPHGTVPRVPQSLSVLDGFRQCVDKAIEEYKEANPHWSERLWALIRDLPLPSNSPETADALFCRGGSPQGHLVKLEGQYARQLHQIPWVPSTRGPIAGMHAFARLATRRLISTGVMTEELGDKLLPYVVAEDQQTLAKLADLGIGILEDPPSATPATLVRGLSTLAEALDSDWGREHIVGQRALWRLVRGAIQDIYRALNQPGTTSAEPKIRLAVKTAEGIRFQNEPLYFAEPGSEIERAFSGMLPLIDVDRAYSSLFHAWGVIRLSAEETVNEILLGSEEAKLLESFKTEIIEELAPHLLALVASRSDRSRDAERVVPRLKHRLQVFAMPKLILSLELRSDPSIRANVQLPHIYLQKRLLPYAGAVEETHYGLYVCASPSTEIHALDGDALGNALARIFFEPPSSEMLSLFPRVVSRYQLAGGDKHTLERFLFEHLGVPYEVQELARDLMLGEHIPSPPTPPPPPVAVQQLPMPEGEDPIRKHREMLQHQLEDLVDEFGGKTGNYEERARTKEPTGPSPEQIERGRRGEQEILRRLRMPGGWAGFSLVADHRLISDGYDFLCALNGIEVMIEVKTFSRNGSIVITGNEIRAAAASEKRYYLIGVLDDNGPPMTWQTFTLNDPLSRLFLIGTFRTQLELQAKAVELFDLR